MKCLKRSLLLFVCVAAMAGGTAEAGTATVTWNRNPEPQVTGYRLSVGHAPGAYHWTIDVGNVVTWTFENLTYTQTYYFALQAYDGSGQVSAYSTEVVRLGQPTPSNDPNPGGRSGDNEPLPHPDLFWQHENGSLSVWAMSGAKKVDAHYLTPPSISDRDWRIAGSGDFDGDRVPDLVWHHRKTGQVAIWLMSGRTMRSSVTVGTEPDLGWTLAATGDMNGDSDPDLIWQHRTTGNLLVWFMQGTSTIGSGALSPGNVSNTWRLAAAADFDLDGKTDLLWRHKNGSLSAWLMNGMTMRSSQHLTPSSILPVWDVAAVADFNRDGRPDIVFRKDDGFLAMWFMNGLKMTTTTMLNPKFEGDLQWTIVGPK